MVLEHQTYGGLNDINPREIPTGQSDIILTVIDGGLYWQHWMEVAVNTKSGDSSSERNSLFLENLMIVVIHQL